jgi:hypothetical protein
MDIGVFIQDGLVAGDKKIVTDAHTFPQDTDLKRGTLLGKVTAGGALVMADKDATDGSENVYAVLAEDVLTGTGETDAACIYLSGQFANDKVIFATGVVADYKESARDKAIYLTPTVAGANGIS